MSADSLSSADDAVEISTFTGGVNLLSDSYGKGQPCRMIRIVDKGSGALKVITARGNERTYTALTDGEEIILKVSSIVESGTTVSKIRVFF